MFSKILLLLLLITIFSENGNCNHPLASNYRGQNHADQKVAQIPRQNQQQVHQIPNFPSGQTKTYNIGQVPNHHHQNGYSFVHGFIYNLNQIPFLKKVETSLSQIPNAFSNFFPNIHNYSEFINSQIPLINGNVPGQNFKTPQNRSPQFPHNSQHSINNNEHSNKNPNLKNLPQLPQNPVFPSPNIQRSLHNPKSFSNESPKSEETAEVPQHPEFPFANLNGFPDGKSRTLKSSHHTVESDEDDDDDEEETYFVPNNPKEPDPEQYNQFNQDNFIQDDFRDVKFPSSRNVDHLSPSKFSDLEEN